MEMWLVDHPWVIALIVKPIAVLAIFVPVWFIERALHRVIPDGKIKRLLYSRIGR